MAIRYTESQRADIIKNMEGKRIVRFEFISENLVLGTLPYWVATLDDGSEFTFRFMAELA